MNANWRKALSPALKKTRRMAVLGIGSPLNSDDAAGMLLIENLKERGFDKNRVLLIAGGSAPENFTGVICGFAPDLLLAIDAARLGLKPGQTALLEEDELCGAGFSTHMLPFSLMLRYLAIQGLTNTLLLGIEPLSTGFGFDLSPPVRQTLRELTDFFARELI